MREITTYSTSACSQLRFTAAIPAWPLRLVLRDMGEEILLASQRVLPAKAKALGFTFLHSELDGALADALGAEDTEAKATTTNHRRAPTAQKAGGKKTATRTTATTAKAKTKKSPAPVARKPRRG